MSAPHEDGVALVSRASANDSSSKHEGSDSEPPKGAAAAGEAFQQHDIRSANDRAPAPSAHSGEDAASDDDEEDGTPCAGSSGGGGTGPLTPEAADAVLKQVRRSAGCAHICIRVRACGAERQRAPLHAGAQIEFYFSDASLPSDKKLLKQIRKDPEGYGARAVVLDPRVAPPTFGAQMGRSTHPTCVMPAVPIKMFANFRKVRALTRDVEAIASALKPSGILELSADNKQVRRRALGQLLRTTGRILCGRVWGRTPPRCVARGARACAAQVKRLVPVPEYDIEEIQKRTVVVENLPVGSTIGESTLDLLWCGSCRLRHAAMSNAAVPTQPSLCNKCPLHQRHACPQRA